MASQVTDNRTPHLDLPLPHKDNKLEDDVPRLREALTDLDSHAGTVDAALAQLKPVATSGSYADLTDKPAEQEDPVAMAIIFGM